MIAQVVVRRLPSLVVVLLVLVAAVFFLREVSPFDPARAEAGPRASQEVVDQTRERLGLNDPIPVQYVRYVGDVVRGDLGESAVTRRAVSTDLRTFLPATLELVGSAFALALILGLLLGVASAARWRAAKVLRFVMVAGSSVPVFLSGLLVIIVFYRKLGWFPVGGRTGIRDAPDGPTGFLVVDGVLGGRFDVLWDAARHLVLPAVCLSLGPAVAIGRALRSSLLQTLRADHVRTARAKGLKETRVVVRHALRNSASPVLSMAGIQVAALFAAELVIEVIFAWPGIGLYTQQAVSKGDFNTIAGVTLVLGAIYVLVNLAVDVLQALADPRITV